MARNCLLSIVGLWLALSALSAEAVTLRYSLREGTELTYRVQVASASRMSGMEDEKIEIKTRIDQTFRLKVTKVLPNGEMEVEQEVLSGKLTLTAEGEEVEGPLSKGKRKFKVSPLGRVTSVAKQPAETSEPAPHCEEHAECGEVSGFSPLGPLGLAGEAAQMDFLMPAIFVPLPENEVGPGDVWEKEIELKAATYPMFFFEGVKPLVLKVKSELLGLTQHGKRKCAHIRTNWEMRLSNEGSTQESFELAATGKIFGEAEWYFDYEKSCTSTAQGILQMLMKISGESALETEEPQLSEAGGGVIKANLKTVLVEQ